MTAPARIAIDQATREAVARASSPFGSAWVSANAGSGKTFVLSRRVVRLLLAGTDPGRILCLTFTKAAAAEMAKRVFATLANWTMVSDEALRHEIIEIGGSTPDAQALAAARRLFARALDTPGGLKIQTIHAFCERLLHQFPFEANVPGHFEILDDRGALALKDEARRQIVAQAAGDSDRPLGRALTCVLTHASDMVYQEALAGLIGERDRLQSWLEAAGGIEPALAQLRSHLALGGADTPETLRQTILTESLIDRESVDRLYDLLCESSRATDTRAAARLAPCVSSSSEHERIVAWLAFFTTANGKLRRSNSLVTRSIRDSWPELEDRLDEEATRLAALLDRVKAAECFETTAALVRLGAAAIGEYQRLKATRGCLDFDDLIYKTVELLSKSGAARWVQYKLDRGLDHILVDEAQDTSPRQWQVIQALAEDFFSGLGASDAVRTVFAVGDEKQSIFSFQGAVPAWFSRVQRELGGKARAAAQRFDDVQLHLSYRSTQIVLSAVDAVFDPHRVRTGVTGETEWPFHTAARRHDLGRVTVWPLIEPPERVEPDDWAAPLDHLSQKSPELRLADRIATTIKDWLVTGETLEGTGAPITPGDILILTRTRGAQTDAIIRSLKSRGVPVAGADRLRLGEHIAVMDMMALGRVMLLPEDDLSLAAVLKSPFVGLSEEALYRVAHGRSASLWAALATSDEVTARDARARLEAWMSEADWRSPFDFFAHILGPADGRRAFMRRLGTEAEDVIDEFLAQALVYEKTETPSLQGFLAWLESAPTEIKRDTDTRRDEIRIMTVHGAKGLEADVVFLVDTGAAPVHASHDPRIVALSDDPDESAPAPLVWMRGKRAMPKAVASHLDALRRRSADEYRRLLYVAMTRARDRLYVCGTKKRNTDGECGWHALVHDALAPESRRVESEDGRLVALEWRAADVTAFRKEDKKGDSEDPEAIPNWALQPAPPSEAEVQRLAPSAAGSEANAQTLFGAPTDSEPSGVDAMRRGRLIHRLLQSLPDHPRDARLDVGRRYLDTVAPDLAEVVALDDIMAILDDPRFAPLFGPGSRAEVDVAGSLSLPGGERAVSGRIDRLAVSDETVYIVDYKTNRPAPGRLADVPRDYVVQLSLYRRLLAKLYPDRSITAGLLWTEIPMLMQVPEESLDAAEVYLISG